MSALPLQPGPGGPPVANGAGNAEPPRKVIRRRPEAANPLVPRKRPMQPPQSLLNRASAATRFGNTTDRPNAMASFGAPSNRLMTRQQKLAQLEVDRRKYGGWSEPPPTTGYTDFPLTLSKSQFQDGSRFHIMRFEPRRSDKSGVDPTNPASFTRPVTVQRRDPRVAGLDRSAKAERDPTDEAEQAEAERLARARAEREAQKASDMAKVAPVFKDPNVKRPVRADKTVISNVPRENMSDEKKKAANIKYEESLPWYVEDADGKNVWKGQYIQPLSERTVALVIHGNGFLVVPLEKYYRFKPKPPFTPFSTEEAEALMSKKTDPARWIMRDEESKMQANEMEATRKMLGGPARVKIEPRGQRAELDSFDVSGDEFADDDENPFVERDNDEDAKDSKDRMRLNHLGANLFGEADELEVDKEEKEDELDEMKRKVMGKRLKRAIHKHEKNYAFFSDSEEESGSDEESAEKKQEEEKQDDKTKPEAVKDKTKDLKAKSDAKGKASSGQPKSITLKQANAKQANAKPADSKPANSLKRPGSPNFSESSGNESLRKKAKKDPSSLPSVSAPQPKVSPTSAASPTRAGSDAEASDGPASSRIKKIKIVAPRVQSPTDSRIGSPTPSAQGHLSPSNVSPGTSTALPTTGSPAKAQITGADILALMPPLPEGIQIGKLLKAHQSRIGDRPGQINRADWIKLVKEVTEYSMKDKLLRRKV